MSKQQGLADAIEVVEKWTCTDEQATHALTAMRCASVHVPAPIVEAFRKSKCVQKTRLLLQAMSVNLGCAYAAIGTNLRTPKNGRNGCVHEYVTVVTAVNM
eukprot:COSAG01_NODE_2418_length_7734_cov_8.527570_2_plen_101_part_00